jgi:hypothetical protein
MSLQHRRVIRRRQPAGAAHHHDEAFDSPPTGQTRRLRELPHIACDLRHLRKIAAPSLTATIESSQAANERPMSAFTSFLTERRYSYQRLGLPIGGRCCWCCWSSRCSSGVPNFPNWHDRSVKHRGSCARACATTAMTSRSPNGPPSNPEDACSPRRELSLIVSGEDRRRSAVSG